MCCSVEVCEKLIFVYKYLHITGGENTTVEIDEPKFGKRKYHKGHHVEGQWVFGGVCRESGAAFLVPVEKRDKETLIPLIKKYILPGTKIISDCWKAYQCIPKLEGFNYVHETVNHSKTFKDPVTGAHTNTIEGMWRHVKVRLPSYRREKQNYLRYLAKYMFLVHCRRNNLEPLPEFFKQAGAIYDDKGISFKKLAEERTLDSDDENEK